MIASETTEETDNLFIIYYRLPSESAYDANYLGTLLAQGPILQQPLHAHTRSHRATSAEKSTEATRTQPTHIPIAPYGAVLTPRPP